ncbi:Chitin synthase, class 5 [Tilletia horrida]|nr:Chitin synthase, class 5 [Tilletia horrida]
MAAAVSAKQAAPLPSAPVKSSPMSSYSRSNAKDEDATKGDLYTFTIGKVDAGMAILIGERASLIEFPSILLPQGVTSGSVVNIRVHRNEAEEERQRTEFEQLQEDILSTFGRESPKPPQLRLRNVTQTSVTLEWDKLSLATSTLLSLDIYRNNQRLAPIPSPLHNTSTKLSGLDVNAEYTFHLVLRTTAGTFPSQVLRVRTHDITDTSGIAVCFGSLFGGGSAGGADNELEEAAREALRRMGAREPTERIQIETTHFVCSDPRDRGAIGGGQGAMYTKAMQLNIPVVQPHWIFACYEQKRMVPISAYYLENDPPNAATIRESIHRILNKEVPQPAAAQQDRPLPPPSKDVPALPPPTPTEEAPSAAKDASAAPQSSTEGQTAAASLERTDPEAEGEASAPPAEIAGVPVVTASQGASEGESRPIPSITVQAPGAEDDSTEHDAQATSATAAAEVQVQDEPRQELSSAAVTETVPAGAPAPSLEDSQLGMEDISLGGNTPAEERDAALEDDGAKGRDALDPPADEEIDLS